jgi:hypothetical protein
MSTAISSSQNRQTFVSNNINDNYVKTNFPTTTNNAPGNSYWKDTFEPGITQRPTKDYSQVRLGVPASTLLTENTKDFSVNCLDKTAELIDAMPEEQRKNAEVVFLADNRPGQEGKTGHAVIRDGDKIIDPMSNASYKSAKEYFQKNPQYSEAGALKAEDVKHILDTQPGSAERKMALKDAKVPVSLQNMMVADSTPTPNPTPGPAPTPPPTQETHQDPVGPEDLPSTAREIGFAIRHPIIASKIGKVESGSTNISTNAARFATNDLGLQENDANEGSKLMHLDTRFGKLK